MKKIIGLLICYTLTQQLSAQQCVGNCTNGLGKITYKSGVVYEGEFKAGKRHGKGTCFLSNGNKFVGFWENDYPQGKGIMYHADGTKQEGLWEKGKLAQDLSPKPTASEKPAEVVADNSTKTNTPELPKGAKCLFGDCTEGPGVYQFENGDVYEGNFKAGLRDGEGIYRYANGDRYEGGFVAQQFHGQGTIFYKNGNNLSGVWNDGIYLGASRDAGTPLSVEEAKDAPEQANPTGMQVWAVIVGVRDYTAMPKLNYSDDDARHVADFYRSPEGGGLDDEHLKLLIDAEATSINITNTVADMFEKAGPNDEIVFYFAGHGMPGAFLPYDYDGKNNMLYHGVINSLILDSKAKYKLCLADACHSGSLLNAVATRGLKADQTVRKFYQSFKDIKSGMALIMSSKSEEFSLESNGLQQGLFSHFLVEGLAGSADANSDKIITVSEAYNYLQTQVNDFSAGFQNPQISGNYDPNMPVGVIGE